MDDDQFWRQLGDSGVKIRPDLSDAAQWVGAVAGRRFGPAPSREAILVEIVRWLLHERQSAGAALDAVAERRRWGRLAGLADLLVALL